MPVNDLCEVVITAPDPEWLKDFSRKLVEDGLCASAHNFSPVCSIYRWRGADLRAHRGPRVLANQPKPNNRNRRPGPKASTPTRYRAFLRDLSPMVIPTILPGSGRDHRTLARQNWDRLTCENFLYGFKAARRAARAAASAPWPSLPLAPAPAGPTPVGWRERRNTGRSTRSKFHLCTWVVPAPAAGLSGAGQNPSRPSVTAGQPHPSSCLVNVHAKTALTEPARTRRWQLSEAGTRVAWALTLKRQPATHGHSTGHCQQSC